MLDPRSNAIGRDILGRCVSREPAGNLSGRLHHLDAIRGIAAFVVVLHHALLSLPAGRSILDFAERLTFIRVFSLGRPAVILFFVLSGFVLGRGLQTRPTSIALFAARRCVRLLPAYGTAILLSFVGFCLVQRHTAENMSPWFNSQWGGGDISLSDLLGHLGMRSGPRQFPLDHVAWSLVHELRLSILLPVFAILCRRFGLALSLMAVGTIALSVEGYSASAPAAFPPGLHGFLFDAPKLGPSLALTARFGLDFAVGFAVAARLTSIEAAVERYPWSRGPGLVFALVLLSATTETAMECGAALLVALVAASKPASIFNRRPLAWLGRVSYSLYLIHLPIMLVCGLTLGVIMPSAMTIAVAVAVALPAAEIFYRLVEAPSIRWSRAIGAAPAKVPAVGPEPLLAPA